MKNPKILYLSCHGILEYDELRMFRDIGTSFFSIGSYIDPERPNGSSRPSLPNCHVLTDAFPAYHEMCHRNAKMGLPEDCHSKRFTKEFLDNFDVIIVMHIPDWIVMNWNVLKGRNVIWRTIGQSIPAMEKKLAECRKEGLKVVRYSPMERDIPNFIGEDALIRFGKYPEDFKPWTGELKQVITVGQSMKQRAWWCNYDTFIAATNGFPTKLYGNGNDEPPVSYSDLIDLLSKNAVYFYTGTRPASYTLNFMEAAFAGIPMVSVGEQMVLFEGHNYFEVPLLLEKYRSGFFSDDIGQLRNAIRLLLDDRNIAEFTSHKQKKMVDENFNAYKIREEWRRFLESL